MAAGVPAFLSSPAASTCRRTVRRPEASDEKERIYDTVVTQDQIQALITDIEEYDESIQSGEWPTRPCNYNSYGKNTDCEYCKMAEIYRG